MSGGQARDETINASTRCSSFSRRARRFSHRAIHSGFVDKSRSAPRSGVRWISSGAVRVTRSRHFGHWTFFRLVRLTVKTLPHAGHFCSRLWALVFIVSPALGGGECLGVVRHGGGQEFAFLKAEKFQRSFLDWQAPAAQLHANLGRTSSCGRQGIPGVDPDIGRPRGSLLRRLRSETSVRSPGCVARIPAHTPPRLPDVTENPGPE